MDALNPLALVLLGLCVGVAATFVASRLRPTSPAGRDDPPGTVEVRAELAHLRSMVIELGQQRAAQQGALLAALEQAAQHTGRLERTTEQLRRVLASAPARGRWGERLADDVLRAAGLVEGVSYLRQQHLPGGGRPDITFLLPDGRHLHLDVKFPLDNYLRHLEASTDEQRAATEAAFLRDVRAMIRQLSQRDYTDARSTVGYVLGFVPNEAVYAFLHERDPALVDLALSQRVVLCSPLSLFAVLAVVRQTADAMALQRTSDEVLDVLGRFGDQWERFVDSLDRLGAQLGTAQRTYDALQGTRRRQLERQLDEVERLRSERPPPGAGAPELRLAGE